jgi:hypothetical protein
MEISPKFACAPDDGQCPEHMSLSILLLMAAKVIVKYDADSILMFTDFFPNEAEKRQFVEDSQGLWPHVCLLAQEPHEHLEIDNLPMSSFHVQQRYGDHAVPEGV